MEIEYFDADVVQVLNDLAAWLLGYIAALALLLLIGDGVYFMYAGGDPQKQKQAKNMATYIILGLLVVMLSYAILKAAEGVAVN
jgi:hypothetical protein